MREGGRVDAPSRWERREGKAPWGSDRGAVSLLLLLLALTAMVLTGSFVVAPTLFSSAGQGLDALAADQGMSASWSAAKALALTVQDPAGLFGYDAEALGELERPAPLPGDAPVSLGITLIPNDPAGLEAFALAVSTPGNPMEGHYLTSSEFDARFAPSTYAEEQVEESLLSHGFRIVGSYPDRSFLEAKGTAAGADALFSTQLVVGALEGHPAVLPATVPVVPSSIEPYVLAVSGLEQNVEQFSLAPLSAQPLGATPFGGPCVTTCNTIYPDWTHFIYGLDGLYNASGGPYWATKSTIGLLLWAGQYGGFSPSDIASFASGMYPGNEPQFFYNAYNLGGTAKPGPDAPEDPSNSPMEITLDMEWSISQAPGATLDVVYVPEGSEANGYSPSPADLENGSAFMLTLSGLTVFSQSFGAPEGDQSFQAAMDLDYEQAASMGISVFSASGDNGGSTGPIGTCTQTPEVEYPAASPWVTAVGGTAPIVNATIGGGPATNQGVSSEGAWHGSGGGYSTTYGIPVWQRTGSAYQTISAGPDPNSRGVPDVAGPAANDTFFYNGGVQDGEGTSFASPFWAGLVAEMAAVRGTPLGFLDPRLYALGAAEDNGLSPAPLRFITEGQTPGLAANCIYYAQDGWDPITGYGVPANAFVLYADLVANYINVTISFSPTDAAPGSTVDVHVVAMNGSAPFSGGSLTVTLWSLPQTLRVTAQLQSQVVTLGANGAGDDEYSIGLSYKYAHILAEAEVFNKHDVGSSSDILTVTLLGTSYSWLEPLTQPPIGYGFFALIMGIAIAIGWVLGMHTPKPGVAPFYRRILRRSPSAVRAPAPSSAPVPATVPRGFNRPAVAPPARPATTASAAARPATTASASLAGRPTVAAATRPAVAPTSSGRIAPGTQASVAPGVTMVVPPRSSGSTPSTTSEVPPPPPPEDSTSSATAAASSGASTAETAAPSDSASSSLISSLSEPVAPPPPEEAPLPSEPAPLPTPESPAETTGAPTEADALPPSSGPVEGAPAPAAPTETSEPAPEPQTPPDTAVAPEGNEPTPASAAAALEGSQEPAAEAGAAPPFPDASYEEAVSESEATAPSAPGSEAETAANAPPSVPTEEAPQVAEGATEPAPEEPAMPEPAPEALPAPKSPRAEAPQMDRPTAAPPAPVAPRARAPPPVPASPAPPSAPAAPTPAPSSRSSGKKAVAGKVSKTTRRSGGGVVKSAACPRCGAPAPASAKTCPSCGAALRA